ncbi:hypothetical protein PINS_up004457 [Pythium insidiosum]|nr:hypothetical protein PINS_up004457 [Pythium insidiosum]
MAEEPRSAKCHYYRSKEKCVLSHCFWCKSAAVPSSCYTEEEAKQLPSAVFECSSEVRLQEADCHSFKDQNQCVQHECYWCKSAAVRSSCYTEEEAQQLPPAVFECKKEALATELSWVLKSLPGDAAGMTALYSAWKHVHQKKYASPLENEMRRTVFEVNARAVVEHNNKADATFSMELNQFADMTWEEFKTWYLGAPQNCSATHTSPKSPLKFVGDVPEEKDWRKDGVVSPVKYQGKCGSCWTFSTTGVPREPPQDEARQDGAALGAEPAGLRAGVRQPRLQRRAAVARVRVCALQRRHRHGGDVSVRSQGRQVQVQHVSHWRAGGLGREHHVAQRRRAHGGGRHRGPRERRVPGRVRLPLLQGRHLHVERVQVGRAGREPRGAGGGLRHRGAAAVLDRQE